MSEKPWSDCEMDLRDRFAGQALSVLSIAAVPVNASDPQFRLLVDRCAVACYQIAEAMLRARCGEIQDAAPPA